MLLLLLILRTLLVVLQPGLPVQLAMAVACSTGPGLPGAAGAAAAVRGEEGLRVAAVLLL